MTKAFRCFVEPRVSKAKAGFLLCFGTVQFVVLVVITLNIYWSVNMMKSLTKIEQDQGKIDRIETQFQQTQAKTAELEGKMDPMETKLAGMETEFEQMQQRVD